MKFAVNSVDHSTVYRWTNSFRGGSVSIDNDPRPGRPRTSTDKRSVKLVADSLEEYRRATCEELLETQEFQQRQYYAFWLMI